jgi:hypothetical protein
MIVMQLARLEYPYAAPPGRGFILNLLLKYFRPSRYPRMAEAFVVRQQTEEYFKLLLHVVSGAWVWQDRPTQTDWEHA